MASKINKQWEAEKRRYEKFISAVTGEKIRVLDIEPENDGAVGYTSSRKTIHIAREHEIMEGLSEEEKMTFREGVVVHEMLHQVYTNFRATERAIQEYQPRERGIFANLSNILEDPAIEYFAPKVIGGFPLTALRFAIAHTYKVSPHIEESESAFGQYASALINFGDMGLLKGDFTFPEAKECFRKTAKLFADGIEQPNGAKRVDISKEIMEISKPLWEQMAKDQEEFEKMMSEILKEMSKRGKSAMNGSGRGANPESDGEGEEGDKKSSRRKITIKKISKEEMDAMGESGGSGGPLPDGDITVYVCDEDDKKSSDKSGSGISIPGSETSSDEKSSDSKSGESGKDEKGDSSDKEGKDSKGKDGEKSEDNKNSKGKDGDGKDGKEGNTNDSEDGKETESDGSQNNPFTGHHTGENRPNQKIGNKPLSDDYTPSDEKNSVGEISEEEYNLTDEDLDYIKAEAEKAMAEYEEETNGDKEDTTPLGNFDIESPKLGKKTCLNYRITYEGNSQESLEKSYQANLEKLAPGIKSTVVQLRKIFEQDYEEREYRTSGRVNLKRVNSGRVTSRIFDKRRAPSGKSDIAVMLVVDESGSMSCSNKYESAAKCCIALSEIFDKLNIPVYVMGFTADTKGYDVVHNHYITWKNNHNDRLKLLNIDARANNCDGYSIRYATEVLKKSRAKNKLMIVLSDGQPAAYHYDNGVADTKDAIRDAKKSASVLGVAIGNSDTETIYYMYEKDFLHISKVDDLFAGLAKKIREIIKGWD